MENKNSSLLVTFLKSAPRLKIVASDSLPKNIFPGQDGSGIEFFYDWLRAPGRKIIGVRLTSANDKTDALIGAVPSFPYTRGGSKELETFFSNVREYDSGESSDQAFGRSGLFKDKEGQWSMVIDLYSLTAAELADLRRYL